MLPTHNVTWSDLDLRPVHRDVLTARGIDPATAHAQGYRSSRGADDLKSLGYRGEVAEVSALVIPLHDAEGVVIGHQIRPDSDVVGRDGKVQKYISPPKQANRLDVPRALGAGFHDPDIPVVVTEGPLKAAAATSRGVPTVSLQGVWSWKGRNERGGAGAVIPDLQNAIRGRTWIVGYDSDAMQKQEVHRAARALGKYLEGKPGNRVRYLLIPDTGRKLGIDDWFVDNPDLTPDELRELVDTHTVDTYTVAGEQVTGDRTPVLALDIELGDLWCERYASTCRFNTSTAKWMNYRNGVWQSLKGDSIPASHFRELSRHVWAYRLKEKDGALQKVTADDWLYQASRISSVLREVESNPRAQVTDDAFDQHPYLINLSNGTYNLRSGELLDHDPGHLLTGGMSVSYERDAEAPEFLRTVHEILPDREVREFVRRLFAMALIGEVRDHIFAVFVGTGANGKSLLLEIMQALFGQYATGVHKELLVETKFEGHPTHLMTLRGKRLAIASEFDRNARWDVAMVKSLTGGDRITARAMQQDEVTFKPSHTMVMATNHRPSVGEGEKAFWRRYREVPFTQSFEGREDTTLADRIIGRELPGVLQWVLGGLQDYLKDGLGYPDAVRAATSEAREEADPLSRFVHERLRVTGDEQDVIRTREVYDAWNEWATTEGDNVKVGSYLHFGRALKASTSTVTVTQGTTDPYKKVSIVTGVCWKSENDPEVEVKPDPVEVAVEVADTPTDSVSAGHIGYGGGSGTSGGKNVSRSDMGNEEVKNTKTSYSGDSRGAISTTSTTPTPTPETSYTESDYGGSTVTTGLLADGSVNPEYRITAQGERGTEVVPYPEYVRRMKLAGKWVEPEVGFTWYPLADAA